VPGTIPLNVYWHGSRQDNFTCAHPQGQKDALDAGYTFIRTCGYVYPAHGHPHGAIHLKSYWNGSRNDNFVCADKQGEHDAHGAGYTFVRNDCAILPSASPIGGGGGSTPESLANTGRRVAFESALGGFFMHVHGGSAQNDAKLTLWDESAIKQDNLQWTIAKAPQGYYLQSCANPAFVAHQHGNTHDDGGACTLWDSRTHGSQGNVQVTFTPRSGDTFSIQFVHSNKCLHVHGAVRANGTPITQWGYVEQDNLKWRMRLL